MNAEKPRNDLSQGRKEMTNLRNGTAMLLLLTSMTNAGCTRAPIIAPNAPPAATLRVVDRVVVQKAARKLLLMHGTDVVRSYHVELGLNPTGQKERSGDSRTPEGTYRIAGHNAQSDYFLSLKVSYPNQADEERARAHHWDAGGAIMIHGMPNDLKHEPQAYESHDWTDGCIAVSNADMAEIWTLTPDNVRIDILP
jgi:murein L,D-transpeptidase YafK